MQSDQSARTSGHPLGSAVEKIVGRLFEDPERRAEHLGEAFLACEQAVRERPEAYRAALQRRQASSDRGRKPSRVAKPDARDYNNAHPADVVRSSPLQSRPSETGGAISGG